MKCHEEEKHMYWRLYLSDDLEWDHVWYIVAKTLEQMIASACLAYDALVLLVLGNDVVFWYENDGTMMRAQHISAEDYERDNGRYDSHRPR